MQLADSVCCPVCGMALVDPLDYCSKRWRTLCCRACSHGFQHQGGLATKNTHFEGDSYIDWRRQAAPIIEHQAVARVSWILSRIRRKPGRVLELGCSTGETLGEMSRRGWKSHGVDLSSQAIEVARSAYPDVQVDVGTEKRFLQRGCHMKFDLIMAFHVLEHISDVQSLIRNCRRLCTGNGNLVFFVPNWNSWSRWCFGDSWPDMMTEHLHFFTAKSIRQLFQSQKIDIESISTKGKSWAWLGGAARVVRGVSPSPNGDQLVSGRETMPGKVKMRVLSFSDFVFKPFLLCEQLLGAGNELRVIARNPNSQDSRAIQRTTRGAA